MSAFAAKAGLPAAPATTAAFNKYSTAMDPFAITLTVNTVSMPLTVHQTNKEESWPGGALWDPGVVLVKLFQKSFGSVAIANEHPTIQALSSLILLRDTTVVELGCGVGLTGIALGALGAKHVLVTDMPVVIDAVTRANVKRNELHYSTKANNNTHSSSVVALPLLWGDAASTREQVDELFSTLAAKNDGGVVNLVLAADIAYACAGAFSHFDPFMATLLGVWDRSDANRELAERGKEKGGGAKKKKKGKKREPETSKGGGGGETIFIYCHRRRMAASEDLLHLIYQEFEDVLEPIGAESIDGKMFYGGKRTISVHILKRRQVISD